MSSNKIDCITFFQENLMFDLRFNILKDHFDKFIVCESKFDHLGNAKKLNFDQKRFNDKKITYIVLEKKFPKQNDAWKNQALQREYILNEIKQFKNQDYIFFSDPDEIPNPDILENFNLDKKYGIFYQDCFNYKFNLFNPYESPWEGTRVTQKKNLKSLDYLRQKILVKNIKKPFWKINIEKSIQIFDNGGWHFNNILTPEEISSKLKSFAHIEFSEKKFSDIDVIKKKISEKKDLFNRGHIYKVKKDISYLPQYILNNINNFDKYIVKNDS
jgi:beta-1,4-mannosyl-glycoprotein beta-1,4-N-acetylglucosaminyltransferase